MIKIANIIGVRPQFIKYCSISNSIKRLNDQRNLIEDILIHTGQHYDYFMSKVFFDELGIKEPDYHLGVGSGPHGEQTGQILQKVEEVLFNKKPDIVFVYGDTNSTLGGALAAAKLKIPIAHIEAGLRSFNKNMPEEINRSVTDHVSTILFCPTEIAVKNLLNEGFRTIVNNGKLIPLNYFSHDDPPKYLKIDKNKPAVINVGDVMYDAILFYKQIVKPTDATRKLIYNLGTGYYLVTVHRAENTDNPERLRSILEALTIISETTPVVLPMHPRTRKFIHEYRLPLDGITIIEPVGYIDMIFLVENCEAVFTDSGGLQKEAYFFHKPCVTLREETEWKELVESGFNILVNADRDTILKVEKLIGNRNIDYSHPFYGTGDAGDKIIQILLNCAF